MEHGRTQLGQTHEDDLKVAFYHKYARMASLYLGRVLFGCVDKQLHVEQLDRIQLVVLICVTRLVHGA